MELGVLVRKLFGLGWQSLVGRSWPKARTTHSDHSSGRARQRLPAPLELDIRGRCRIAVLWIRVFFEAGVQKEQARIYSLYIMQPDLDQTAQSSTYNIEI